jgi:hypothetical protein
MSDHEFAALSDLIRTPAFELPDDAVAADIRPVHAGLFGRQGHPLLVSSVGMLPSMRGALEAVRGFFGERWAPGDVALTNDMDAGAVNACEIIIIAPAHPGAALVVRPVVRVRVPDLAGGARRLAHRRWMLGRGRAARIGEGHGARRYGLRQQTRFGSTAGRRRRRRAQQCLLILRKAGHAYSRDHDKLRDQITRKESRGISGGGRVRQTASSLSVTAG